ncbi:low temperature requirement protein LtrA [Lipingzhangella halophila]|uniref:Low temperature requirement protein LtrA n=1 Tax=Lipingzhangella halophila TaxID=1783352 RepID=A0A7W7W2D5_9ACTN|nr:low temperature requirement protein A [Lipingzhangella halophila]MBB4930540.1 low temperature requirement protein LtrA [Lipingzhangella halophila]
MTPTEPTTQPWRGIARHDGHRRSEVGPVELFFDLVYVFAIIQLSHVLIEHLSWRGFAETAIIFAAIWWGWNYTAWVMNWLNPANTRVQLLNAVLMVASLGMAAAIPDAFGGSGLLFAGCFVFMGLLRPVFMIVGFRGRQLASNYTALLSWSALAGVAWIAGALLPPEVRLWVWLLAVVIDYAAPLLNFRIPGLVSAPMERWDTDAEHLAERNRLVFIIALGESILLMGGALVDEGILNANTVLSLLLGFAGLTVLWWNYFALAGHEVTGGEGGTGALRSAFAYAHALMVLGAIVVAVSIELRITHDHLSLPIILVTIGGPLVYLAGNLLFLRSRFGRVARSRFGAAAALAVIGAVAAYYHEHLPIAAVSLAVLLVMATLAVLTARSRSRTADPATSLEGGSAERVDP